MARARPPTPLISVRSVTATTTTRRSALPNLPRKTARCPSGKRRPLSAGQATLIGNDRDQRICAATTALKPEVNTQLLRCGCQFGAVQRSAGRRRRLVAVVKPARTRCQIFRSSRCSGRTHGALLMSGGRSRGAPTGAAWSGYPVPGAPPKPRRLPVRRYSPAKTARCSQCPCCDVLVARHPGACLAPARTTTGTCPALSTPLPVRYPGPAGIWPLRLWGIRAAGTLVVSSRAPGQTPNTHEHPRRAAGAAP